MFDNLTYVYYEGEAKNRLRMVQDAIQDNTVDGNDIDDQGTNTNYTYDLIGNMVGDLAEGLTITWLPNGKIATVTKVKTTPPENWQLRFRYDAAGRRVAKEKYTGSNYATMSKGTYYVYEAS
ncbi:MAG: hypothetical protein JNL32_10540, partial [Candidatus Kapabacteria bacterium]|nr:hypothetical protein [Candidatus Kapabacteria bacterium]